MNLPKFQFFFFSSASWSSFFLFCFCSSSSSSISRFHYLGYARGCMKIIKWREKKNNNLFFEVGHENFC
jgi:hypothetical protein